MKSLIATQLQKCAVNTSLRGPQPPAWRPGYLHLVTVYDLENLRRELANGEPPPDFEAKLTLLAEGNLGERFVEHNCRTMIALLRAAQEGSFKEVTSAERDRLLRVLAYVRKDDDAVPDYRSDGFIDDQQEMRSVTTELSPLLQRFKYWRLRHQVPAMWLRGAATVTIPVWP